MKVLIATEKPFAAVAVEGIKKYFQKLSSDIPCTVGYNLSVSFTDSEYYNEYTISKIHDEIASGRPVVVTTLGCGKYKWHTMCVCGYREKDGEAQIQIHRGWWGSDEFERDSSGELYATLEWIPASDPSYAYFFTYDNPLSAYSDIPEFTNYAYDGILYCVKNNIMIGTDAGVFNPGKKLDRGQAVQMLYKAAGSPSVAGLTEPFADVNSSNYFYNAVLWAYNSGVVKGTDLTHFSPKNDLTREQLAVMLYAFAKYLGKDTSHLLAKNFFGSYWGDISSWARTQMRWAGYGFNDSSDPSFLSMLKYEGENMNRNYRPGDTATRAETAYAIYVLLQLHN